MNRFDSTLIPNWSQRVPRFERQARMIEELDRVILTRDLPEKKLKAGDVGTVVLVYKNGEGFEVEFMTLGGGKFRG